MKHFQKSKDLAQQSMGVLDAKANSLQWETLCGLFDEAIQAGMTEAAEIANKYSDGYPSSIVHLIITARDNKTALP